MCVAFLGVMCAVCACAGTLLQVGDVIVGVNGESISSFKDCVQRIRSADKVLTLRVQRAAP